MPALLREPSAMRSPDWSQRYAGALAEIEARGRVAGRAVLPLSAKSVSWTDTGLDLGSGAEVTMLASWHFTTMPGLGPWRWGVDRLASSLREDELNHHDYLSIAVEWDSGKDITYFRSVALPVGTVFACPIPQSAPRETHVVVRSGEGDPGALVGGEPGFASPLRRDLEGGA